MKRILIDVEVRDSVEYVERTGGAMIDKRIPYKLTPDELVFLRDAARFGETSDIRSTLTREQRQFLAEAIQDAIIKQGSHAMHSTITLEVHQLDDEAFEAARVTEPPSQPHVMKCIFCQQPVKQCVCDAWVRYRQ